MFTTSYYKQLKYPLDITYRGDSCEGFTATMLLPASNVVKNDDPIQLHGNMESFTQLNYSSVHDFTVFEDITLTKINDSMGTTIPDIPDIKDTTIMSLNQQLTHISKDYPWELPLWSKILIMVVLILLTIVVLIICCICCQCANCAIE